MLQVSAGSPGLQDKVNRFDEAPSHWLAHSRRALDVPSGCEQASGPPATTCKTRIEKLEIHRNPRSVELATSGHSPFLILKSIRAGLKHRSPNRREFFNIELD